MAAGWVPGAITGSHSSQEEAKAKEEEGVPDDEGWVKVTRRGRRPVLPRTEAASLRVLEREKRKRARKELLNFYAWQHRQTKMERKGVPPAYPPAPRLTAPSPVRGRESRGRHWTWRLGHSVLRPRLSHSLWGWSLSPTAAE